MWGGAEALRSSAPRLSGTEGQALTSPLLAGFDLDRDDGVHIREQVHRDLVDPDASDGLVQVDVAAVNLHPGLALDLLCELGRRHAAEHPTFHAFPRVDVDRVR